MHLNSPVLWWYVSKNQFLNDNSDPLYYRAIVRLFGYSIPYTLVAFCICFISSTFAIGMYVVLFVVFAFPHLFALKVRSLITR